MEGGKAGTKAILVQRRSQGESSCLEELQNLAETAGYTVVASVEQVRRQDSKFQVGRGKVEELADLAREYQAEKIVFDNTLKPVQAYNIAKATQVETIDRFQLILEIFAKRAYTYEARLQIQLAKLRYELTRAKEKVRLAKMEEQPGFSGLGAYEVDVYYETVRRRVNSIRKKLRKKRQKRSLHRARRAKLGFSSVSLAGYTNAGKSSLFNAFTEGKTAVDDGVFTTLSTSTRFFHLNKRKTLLTDTVGFVDRLPLMLIEAFHSTLEETIVSDVIILVVDANELPVEVERKLSCSFDTIERIGANGIPLVTALNKIDLLGEREIAGRVKLAETFVEDPVPISAKCKVGLEQLKRRLVQHLEPYMQAAFTAPLSDSTMSLISWLYKHADVKEVKYDGDEVSVLFQAAPRFADKVKGRLKPLGGTVKRTSKVE